MLIRVTRQALAAAVIALLCLLSPVGSAANAEEFTYWSLWEVSDGQWVDSQTGAADIELDDESVIAAKYLRSDITLTEADAPSQPAQFDELCPDASPAPDGSVNVAVVIDYGTSDLVSTGQSPPATSVSCQAISKPASGAAALSQAATVSAESDGFITALNGYPGSGAEATGTDDNRDSEESGLSVIWIIILIAVVVLIILAIVVQVRRSRQSQ